MQLRLLPRDTTRRCATCEDDLSVDERAAVALVVGDAAAEEVAFCLTCFVGRIVGLMTARRRALEPFEPFDFAGAERAARRAS